MKHWVNPRSICRWLRRGAMHFVHASEQQRLAEAIRGAGFDIVELEGRNIRSEHELLVGLGMFLQFPAHYGKNWDAFSDCFGDLCEAREAPLALFWTDADCLANSNLRDFAVAVTMLHSVVGPPGPDEELAQFSIFLIGNNDSFRNPTAAGA